MKIKNKSKYISTTELRQCIGLLHSDYLNLDVELIIYNNKFQPLLKTISLTRRLDWFTYKMARSGTIGGSHRNRLITMFPFNYVYNSQKHKLGKYKLFLIFGVFHELRHAYQMVYKERKFAKANLQYKCAGSIGYNSQWMEQDANHFAQRMMNKHKKEISNILSLDFKWDQTWGELTVFI